MAEPHEPIAAAYYEVQAAIDRATRHDQCPRDGVEIRFLAIGDDGVATEWVVDQWAPCVFNLLRVNKNVRLKVLGADGRVPRVTADG